MTGAIYEVIDAEDRRYIGQTIHPESRPEISRRKHNGVFVQLLEENLPQDVLGVAENHWIAYRMLHSFQVLNIHRGHGFTPEHRANMSRKHSEEENVAQGQRQIGRTHTPETKANMSADRRGRPQTPARLAWNEAQRGTKQSPEHVAKCVASNTGRKNTAETLAKMSVSAKRIAPQRKRVNGLFAK